MQREKSPHINTQTQMLYAKARSTRNLLTSLRKILIIIILSSIHLQFGLIALCWQPATSSIWINSNGALEPGDQGASLVWTNNTASISVGYLSKSLLARSP